MPLAAPISRQQGPSRTRRIAMLRYSSASLSISLSAASRIGLVARLVAQLGHDVLIFGVDHRRRDLEIMVCRELVEQPPLHVRAGQAVELLALLVAEQTLELVEVVEAELLGEIVVELRLSPAIFTDFTLMSKVAALPLRLAA